MSSGMLSTFTAIVSQWAFWTGVVSVALFAVSRFNITLPNRDVLSPPLRPRAFTTAFRFWLASLTYVGCYATLYLGLLVVGSIPELRDALANALLSSDVGASAGHAAGANPAVGTPAWAALIATAALPAIPVFSSFDEALRLQLQTFASTPVKARMIADDVLKVLVPREPASIDDTSSLEQIKKAGEDHFARFERLSRVWEQLKGDDSGSPRYARFLSENQKLMDGYKHDFSATPDDWHTPELARYVEKKYRKSVKDAARFLVCAMLEGEGTEYRVRRKWKLLGFGIPGGDFEFRPSHIILSIAAVFFFAVVGSFCSAGLYYVVEYYIRGNQVLGLDMTKATVMFFSWSLTTVILYTLPVVLAAGSAMYLLDRRSTDESTPGDFATGAVLTFLGAAMLCFFILLAYGVLAGQFKGQDPLKVTELAPWVVPPALVATTFMVVSTLKIGTAKYLETLAFIVIHAGVAALGSLLAYFLWSAEQGLPRPELNGVLPRGSFIYLAVCTAICVGGGIGWVLSSTDLRRSARRLTGDGPAAIAPHLLSS